ncbi:MAG: InlB B-repeat-containing protein [Nitrososphaerota archaeon]|nr:InlB B-repeat-containing protein [Nitrososphaerota archaeon]
MSVVSEVSPFASACVYSTVTVNNSYATVTGAGTYQDCKTVTINAGTRDGYTFVGWTVNSGGVKLKSATSPTTTFTMPAKNVVVTANWTPITYSISYALNDGANAPGNPTSYTANNLPLNIATPTRSGYVFSHWKITCVNGSESVLPTSGIPAGTIGNVLLSAIWDVSVYSIEYRLNGGVNAPGNPVSYNVANLPSLIANPTLRGYNFLYWKVMCANGTQFILTGSGIPAGTTGDLVVIAIWDALPIMYTITYNLDGGINGPGNTNSYAVTDNFPIPISNPVKANHVFLGWVAVYANGTVSGPTVSYSIPLSTIGDVVLTAVWTPVVQTFNISYELSGGTNAIGAPTTYSTNNLPLNIANPHRSGYIFSYWIMRCTDGSMSVLQNGVVPAGTVGDVVLTAVWAVAPTYTITYMLNGGVNAVGNPVSYSAGGSSPVGIANPSMSGHTFSYWIVVYDNGSMGILPGSGIPVGTTGNISLIAVWN